MRIDYFHVSWSLLACTALLLFGEALRAGAPPKDDDKKAGVRFASGSPHAEKNPDGGWKITAGAKYHYDAGWEFKEMKIQVFFVKKGDKNPESAFEQSWPSEATIGTPGEVSASFNIRAPVEGETIEIKGVLTAKHPIFGEQEWSMLEPGASANKEMRVF